MISEYSKTKSNANLSYFGAGYASFAVINTTVDTMNISFIDTKNTIRYHYSMHKDVPNIPLLPIEPPLSQPSNNVTINNSTNTTPTNNNDDDKSQLSTITNFIESNQGKYVIASFSLACLLIMVILSYTTCYTSSRKNVENKSVINIEQDKQSNIKKLKMNKFNKKNYRQIQEEQSSENDLSQQIEEEDHHVEENIEVDPYELRKLTRSMKTSSSSSSLSMDSLESSSNQQQRVLRTVSIPNVDSSNNSNYINNNKYVLSRVSVTTRPRAVTYSV